MGVAGSKDDRGVRVLQALPPGFLDEKGKELRNNLDYCLEQNGWYFTIGATTPHAHKVVLPGRVFASGHQTTSTPQQLLT